MQDRFSNQLPDESKKGAIDTRALSEKVEEITFTHGQLNFIAIQSATVITEVGMLTDYAIEPTSSLLDKNTKEANNEIKEISNGIGVMLGFVFLIWYFWKKHISPFLKKQENPEALEEPKDTKKLLIEWSDRYEGGSLLGSNIGQFIGALIPMPSQAFTELLKIGLGAAIGFATGIIAAVFMEDTFDTEAEKYSIFKLGKDSWPTYTKLGSLLGGLAGSLVLGLIGLFSPIPGGLILGLALGAAGGSAIGFALAAAIVPLTQKISHYFNDTDYQPDKTKITEQKSSRYRTNYITAGASLGATLGGIVGFVLGLIPPFVMIPFASLALASIFSAVFGLIGAATFGIAGPYISKKFDPDNKNINRWDYGARSGLSCGSEAGKLSANIFKLAEPSSRNDLVNVTAHGFGLIGGTIGLAHDLYTCTQGEPENNGRIFSWSKHIVIFGSTGSAIGGLIGIVGGPIGMAIGASVGWLIGSIVGVVFGERICKSGSLVSTKILEKFGGWMLKNKQKAKKPTQSVSPSPSKSSSLFIAENVPTIPDIPEGTNTQLSETQFEQHQGNLSPPQEIIPPPPLPAAKYLHSPRFFTLPDESITSEEDEYTSCLDLSPIYISNRIPEVICS